MEKEKFLIGYYVLDQDEIFRNSYEFAAWYEDVLVKAGKYPVYAREYSFNERLRKYENDLKDYGNIFCSLPGTVVQDDFSPHFGGVAIGDKSNVNTGKQSSYVLSPYAHSIAHAILEGKSCYELVKPFKAVYVDFMFDNKPCRTANIINTEKE